MEINVGVLLACLPSMRPLLRILLRQGRDMGSEGGALAKETSGNRRGGRRGEHSRHETDNSFSRLINTDSSVCTGNTGEEIGLKSVGLPERGINVENEIQRR